MDTTCYDRIPALLAAVLLAACASNGREVSTEIDQALDAAAGATTTPTAPPTAVSEALLPPVGVALPGAAVAEPRFDIVVENTDARTFFMGLVQDTPYNMVVHPDVTGRVTLNLKGVTVPEVMDTVREVYGYDYRRTASGFLVLPATLQTRLFEVNYLNLVRSGESKTRVNAGQLTQIQGQQPQQPGLVGGFGGPQTAVIEPSTKIETQSEADFWKALKTTLQSLVGSGNDRQVIINEQTGVVAVRALPSELRAVEEYLRSIQASAVRQVVLEAKIIEVELGEGFQSGINWAAVGRDGSRTLTGGMIGGADIFEDGFSAIRDTPLDVQPGNPITGFTSTALGGAFALAIDATDFNAFIELLKSQGDTRVLSSPRVSTVNNQKAVIKVGSDEFFVTGITSNTTAGTATNTNTQVQLTPFFSGIALDVTPQIAENGEVILHIHPSVSEVVDQTKEIVFQGQLGRLPLAFSTVRESDSIVRAKNGQIVVIGGLMKTTTRQEEIGVPFLGDIPLLGRLFKHTRDTERKSELVILLKPIVVDSDEVWRELAREPQARLRETGP